MNAGSEASRLRVLIVEDEAITALAESRLIASLGYEPCGIASNGEDAMAAYSRERPSIICMDIGLSGPIDGIETASRIMARGAVIIIFITGYDDEDRLRRARSLHPACLLTKPVTAERLRRGLEAAASQVLPE
jgi:CheY-like chemotaxis protein